MKIRGITTLKKIKGYFQLFIKKVSFMGTQHWCPICQKHSNRFDSYGIKPRPDALCIHCNSLERHRLVWLYLQKNTALFNNSSKTMLHIAPENCLERKFRKVLGQNYVTADLYRSDVQVKMDVANIPLSNETFDIIFCSHVLEHIPDDRKALREFYRILKPGGWMMLLVPVSVDKTIEDPTITDPQTRLELFGQDDHVRKYGPDVINRIHESGFHVKQVLPGDFLTSEQIKQFGTTSDTPLFYCTKL